MKVNRTTMPFGSITHASRVNCTRAQLNKKTSLTRLKPVSLKRIIRFIIRQKITWTQVRSGEIWYWVITGSKLGIGRAHVHAHIYRITSASQAKRSKKSGFYYPVYLFICVDEFFLDQASFEANTRSCTVLFLRPYLQYQSANLMPIQNTKT